VTVLPVDGAGLVDPDAVARAITERTVLVSVMAANSEIGVLQPLAEIGRICNERGVLFHSDAAQAVGKVPLDVEALGLDLVSLCAHKLYGPKGVGALWVRRRRRDGPRIRLSPLIHGGGHERGLRSGTLPVPLVRGLARAVELCLEERESEAKRLSELRDRLLARLQASLDDVLLNGHARERLPGNLNVAVAGVEADALIAALPQLAISTGSACSSARPEPSHVLRALGLPAARVRSSIRVGLGRSNTVEEVDLAADAIVARVEKLRRGRTG
jgi:cysteine desulfurase